MLLSLINIKLQSSHRKAQEGSNEGKLVAQKLLSIKILADRGFKYRIKRFYVNIQNLQVFIVLHRLRHEIRQTKVSYVDNLSMIISVKVAVVR